MKKDTGHWRKVAGSILLAVVLVVTFYVGKDSGGKKLVANIFLVTVLCDTLIIFAFYLLGNYRLVKSGKDEPINKPKNKRI